MNRNELFQGFEEIDESLLRRSEKSEPTGVKNTVIKWGLVAAFCCLTAAAAVAAMALRLVISRAICFLLKGFCPGLLFPGRRRIRYGRDLKMGANVLVPM